METERSAGRRVGLLLLAHLPAGLMVPYILLVPVISPPGFLENAAGRDPQIRAAVLLMFLGSALALGASIAALPVVWRYSVSAAAWLGALAVLNVALQAVDSGAILSMLSVSKQAASGEVDAAISQAAAAAVGPARRWAHYTHLLVLGGWLLALHGALLRFALVPRLLAGVGLAATLSQMIGVTLRGILGYPLIGAMAMPLAGTYLALGLWLAVKGFAGPRPAPS